MAGKTTRMSKVNQLITLKEQGRSIPGISKILGINRNTVKSYLKKLIVMKIDAESFRSKDDMEVEGLFHSGNPSYKPEQRTREKYQSWIWKIDFLTGNKEQNKL